MNRRIAICVGCQYYRSRVSGRKQLILYHACTAKEWRYAATYRYEKLGTPKNCPFYMEQLVLGQASLLQSIPDGVDTVRIDSKGQNP